MQKICQKKLFLFQIIKVFDKKKSWKVSNKIIHNFPNFGHSNKFFSNLEMADRVKINDIKQFDEIWCSRLFQNLHFRKYFMRLIFVTISVLDSKLSLTKVKSQHWLRTQLHFSLTSYTAD